MPINSDKSKKRVFLVIGLLFAAVVVAVVALSLNFGISGLPPSAQTEPGNVVGHTTSANIDSSMAGVTSTAKNSMDSNSGQGSQTGGRQENTQPSYLENQDKAGEKSETLKLLKSMTLEEKVGQLVIVGVEGYNNDEHSELLIKNYHVGGFILFKKNIRDSAQLSNLLNSLKASNASANKVPIFLSVDEEGGRVSRLPDEFKKIPSNKVIGKKDDSDLSYKVGAILGKELYAFGFNMDFAPVLDINSNPKNPVIGDRSFGTTPELVSRLGVETMKGIQSQNIISVVKHFPGHGDTSVDSHVGLPKVNHDLERLMSFELVPFNAALENGADTVMIAHILLPKLDSKNPASFSKAVITDLLRTKMNYNDVVITDDFTMGAITKNFDIGAAAVKSIQVGGDIVLVCHGFDKQEAVIKALLEAARTGRISAERLEESVYRVLELKRKYSLADSPSGAVDPKSINSEIAGLFK